MGGKALGSKSNIIYGEVCVSFNMNDDYLIMCSGTARNKSSNFLDVEDLLVSLRDEAAAGWSFLGD